MHNLPLLPALLASLAALAPTTALVAKADLAPAAVVDLGDRTVTYIEIAPPAQLPAATAPVAPDAHAARASLAAETAPARPRSQLLYSATVYVGVGTPLFTELRWRHQDRDYVAVSNVDFRHLGGVFAVETPTMSFDIMPFVFRDQADSVSSPEQTRLRALPRPLAGAANFVVVEPATALRDPAAQHGIAALHAYFAAHRAELEQATQQREIAAHEAELARATRAATPRQNRTVRYWINQDGGRP